MRFLGSRPGWVTIRQGDPEQGDRKGAPLPYPSGRFAPPYIAVGDGISGMVGIGLAPILFAACLFCLPMSCALLILLFAF